MHYPKSSISLNIFFLLLLAAFCFGQTAAPDKAPPPLVLNTPIEGQITEGGTQTFALHMEPNQIAVLVLEQRDAQLEFVINNAKNGEKLHEVNFNYENFGDERFLLDSEDASRDLMINVVRFSDDHGKGNFKLTLTEQKTAESKDKLRIAAQSEMTEGLKLSSRAAIPLYENALKTAHESGDSDLELTILVTLLNAYVGSGDFKKAIGYNDQLPTLLEGHEKSYAYTKFFSLIGMALLNSGEPKRAIELLSKNISRAHTSGFCREEAFLLQTIGNGNQLLGKSEEAFEYAQRSYNLAVSCGDKTNQIFSSRIMAFVKYDQGDFLKAIEIIDKALPIAQNIGNTTMVYSFYTELGRDYSALGQIQKALNYHQLSLTGKRQLNGNRFNIAVTLSSIAAIYSALGQNSRAIDYQSEAVQIYNELGYQDATVRGLLAKGFIYRTSKDYEKARESFLQALKICEGGNFPLLLSQVYSNLGIVEIKLNHTEAAIEYLQKSIRLNADIKLNRSLSTPLITLANLYISLGQLDKASDAAAQALESARTIGDRVSESNALFSLARVKFQQHNSTQALDLIKSSLKIVESLRAALISQESRTAYFSTVRDKYDFYIQLLVEMQQQPENQGFGAEAFAASERAKARGLLDLLAESYTDISADISPELKSREQSVQAKISSLQTQMIRAKSAEKPDEALTTKLQQEITRTDDEREQLESEIRRTNPRYAELKYPTTLDLAQTQAMLDERTMLLEYQTGADASFLFAIGKNDFQIIRLPNEKTLRGSVEALRRSISQPARGEAANYLANGRELYQTLLAPVAAQLKTKNKIIISADGALNYLPFEVLLTKDAGDAGFDKLPYLVKDFEISYTPSASVLANLSSAENKPGSVKPTKSFLAFAAPDYGAKPADQYQQISRTTRSVLGENRAWSLSALPYAKTEAEGIAKLFPAGQATVFSGAEATEERAKSNALLSQYRYLHFAVHGLIDEEQPQFSSLVLTLPKSVDRDSQSVVRDSFSASPNSPTDNQNTTPDSALRTPHSALTEDGLLQTPEIFNLRLHADLVTLSACETGLGQEIRGEGIVGLTRAFFYAGTPSVLVSLWSVNDASTAELMTGFYEQLRKNGERNKADALRQAQLKLIAAKRYAHPFYWAPFILQGKSTAGY